jgi:hypothetical protein
MKRMILLALVALGSLAWAPGSEAQSTCPAANSLQPEVASYFLTGDQFVMVRDSLGVGSLTPANLRLLTDSQDQAACSQLRQMIAAGGAIGPSNEPWAFYTAGGFYFLVSAAEPPANRASTSLSYLAVVNPFFQLLKGFRL